MRRTFCRLAAIILLAGLVQGCGTGPKPAMPPPNPKITAAAGAADKAATDFAALAAPARRSGQVPRETDPAVKPLLDAVYDLSVLRQDGVTVGDLKAMAEWSRAVDKVSAEYYLAGTGLTGPLDLAQIGRSATLTARTNENIGRFAPETGRAFDAAMILSHIAGDVLLTLRQTNSAAFQKVEVQQSYAAAQRALYLQFRSSLIALGFPTLNDDWRRARLVPLGDLALSTGKLVVPADGGTLRQLAIDVSQCQGDQQVATKLLSVAAGFPDYSADESPAIHAAHARLVQASCAARAAAARFWMQTRPLAAGGRLPSQSDPAVKPLFDKILDTTAAEGDFPRFDDILQLDYWRVAVTQLNLAYIFAGLDHDALSSWEKTLQDDRISTRIGQNTVQYGADFGRSVDAQLHLMQAMAEVFAARLGDDPRKFTEEQRATFEAFRGVYGMATLLLLKASMNPAHGDAWRQERLTAFEAAARRAPAILTPADATALHSFVAEAARTEKNPQIRARLTHLAAGFAL